jgi:probable F420-dependent oxidoreductase
MMDPFLSLLVAALAAPDLRIGTCVALPLEHDVFVLAKVVATLDRLAGGRFSFGVGVGWNVEELADHRPLPWAQRYRALAECIDALKTLWADEVSEYHGDFYSFDGVWSEPKPAQSPYPPILCGMGGRLGTREAVTWADGWMPMDIALGDVAKKLQLFRRAASDRGRDPDGLTVSIVTFGDPDLATLSSYRDLGVQRVIIGAGRSGWADPGTTIGFLDRYAALIPGLGG